MGPRGVRGNDPDVVARAFRDALGDNPFSDRVVFAVLDRRRGAPVLTAFARVLSGNDRAERSAALPSQR